MKNYGHTWQWSDNPEYTVDVWTDWSYWALPIAVRWSRFGIHSNAECFNLNITFLCFGFSLEIWRWDK